MEECEHPKDLWSELKDSLLKLLKQLDNVGKCDSDAPVSVIDAMVGASAPAQQ